ncbi:MAG: dihydrolipoyl dehydrogenase [Bacteroidetes bacterium]|jgi:dihydrolipoamide dehydrogenase|nr:dihydrolipoyl dehydrogenase [Bacteroidota bacterium]
MSNQDTHQLVVIGAGPGGYRAAFMAADLGMKVTLIDPEANPGGVCLYRGCIPSKALLHLAKVKHEAAEAAEFGMSFGEPTIEIKKVAKWKNKVVQQLTGGTGQLVKARKINYIQGWAKFKSSTELDVETVDGKKDQITFDKCIIATGASPIKLPFIEAFTDKVMSSKEALDLNGVPKKLLVIGGGYIGLEMASIYKGLGSEVSVVEMTPDFLPGTDKDLLRIYKKVNKDMFAEERFETKVTGITENKTNVRVDFEEKDGNTDSQSYDKVLVAIGQAPNSKNIGLENTKVELTDRGFIKVNEQRLTTDENIYAIGDIAGGMLLAHKASHEGMVAAEAAAGHKTGFDAQVIPAVVYTDPEIATVGLSEDKAKDQGINFKKVTFPWSASGRAIAMEATTGMTKLLIDPDTERILGAGIVGRNAGDLITEVALAIEMGATAKDVALTIHPHPTLSETIMEAAEVFYGHPTHVMKK